MGNNKFTFKIKKAFKAVLKVLIIIALTVWYGCNSLFSSIRKSGIWNKISDFVKNLYGKVSQSVKKVFKRNNTNEVDMANTKEKSNIKTKEKKSKKTRRTVVMVICGIMATMVVVGCIAVATVLIIVNRQIEAEGEIDLEELSLNYATIIYSGDEEDPVEYDRIYSAENRTWVDLDRIPKYVRYAFIDVEDERFEVHGGVDWKRTAAATLNQVFHFMSSRQGGSTITQQLIKNVTNDDDISWQRKVREIVRALKLEKKYSKDDIIEAYLNTISLGNNTAGINAAADYYFGKEPIQLTLGETACIAALTSMPVYYDPYINPDNNTVQREYVLSKMLEHEHITKEQYDIAIAEEIVLKDKSKNTAVTSDIKSYFTDTVIEQVISDLVNEKGYSYDRAERLVNSGGLQIYTTVDVRIQNVLNTKYSEDSTFTVGNTNDLPQSAFIVLDKNGAIKGVVGGRGTKTENRGLNRAISSKRQPGSSLKPLSVYMPGIEKGIINWSSMIEDSPVTKLTDSKTGQQTDYPVNVYHDYYGNMTVCEAVQRSTNTVAMRLAYKLTPKVCYDFLKDKLGFSLVSSENSGGVVQSDISAGPMSLGALTNGVTPLEMAGGYLPIMNGGIYYKPHCYTKVYNSKGELLLENKAEGERVVSEKTANITNQLLRQTIYGPYGTAGMASISGITCAGKTGTTDDYHDRWFIGMTPEYLGAVWIGYDQPKEIDVYRISNPCRIWRMVMGDVMSGVKCGSFPESKDVVKMSYCTHTGLLAGDGCESTDVGYYDSSNLPGVCTDCTGGSAEHNNESSSSKPQSSSSKPQSSSQKPQSSSQKPQSSSQKPQSSSSSQSSSSPQRPGWWWIRND